MPRGESCAGLNNAYGPNRKLAQRLLRGLEIEVEAYDPLIGAGIASMIRENTSLIWCESLERPTGNYAGRIVRLNIGFEEPADLIEDLRSALQIFV